MGLVGVAIFVTVVVFGVSCLRRVSKMESGWIVENGKWMEWRMENGNSRVEIGEWRVGIGDWRMESGVSSPCVPRIVLCDPRELRVSCLHSGSVRLWGYI